MWVWIWLEFKFGFFIVKFSKYRNNLKIKIEFSWCGALVQHIQHLFSLWPIIRQKLQFNLHSEIGLECSFLFNLDQFPELHVNWLSSQCDFEKYQKTLWSRSCCIADTNTEYQLLNLFFYFIFIIFLCSWILKMLSNQFYRFKDTLKSSILIIIWWVFFPCLDLVLKNFKSCNYK